MAIEPLVVELKPPPAPADAARRLRGLPKLIWFDSAGGPAEQRRYSYLSASPFDWLQAGECGPLNSLDTIQDWLSGFRCLSIPDLPPFQGGAAGLFGYELGRWFERIPRAEIDEFQLPILSLGFYDWVVAWDHSSGRCWLFSTGFPHQDEGERLKKARTRALQVEFSLTHNSEIPISRDFPRGMPYIPMRHNPLPGFAGVFSNFNRPGFLSAVARAIEYTHAGDCFQVNLAQRLITSLNENPFDLYGRLRNVNPAPFAAYFDAGEFQILSASPERFLQMTNTGRIETRPIKGTRPRGATPERDDEERAALLNSPKDRAENIMIVDLLRNDLGRVCEYGSVTVPAVCKLETYPTVHHLVSEVRGQLRHGLTAIDLLKAAFPGGSVTGAPKVRAMEIIAELEPHVRGPYCGCLGWIGFDGAMDTNILIRTFTACGGWLQFPVGGGIVADSDPQREYEETLHKAAGLLRALE